jgi:hypothetical protein
MLARRLNLVFLVVGLGVALVLLGYGGQIPSDASANEPPEPLSPYSRTGFAEVMSSSEAILVGFVNARGSSTTVRFQIGRSNAFGRWFPPGPPEHFYSGYHPSEIEQGVDGLRPATTYHFRLLATSEGGVTYGKDETFRTPPRSTVAASVRATSAVAAGDGRYVFEQRCDETQGICWSTFAQGKETFLKMESDNHGGEYEVCVAPPRGMGACRPVRLRHRSPGPHGDIGFAARVGVEKSFGDLGEAGQYLVKWKSFPTGLPLSPVLTFDLRANGTPRVPGNSRSQQ